MKCKILFSIPVHENESAILDLIDNYNYFNPDCFIVLHVAKKFGNLDSLQSKLPRNVYINSRRIWSGRADGSQLFMHFINYEFALNSKIEFDYFSLNASNEFFIRKDVYQYMSEYDAGFEMDNINRFLSYKIPKIASMDPFLLNKKKENLIKDVYYSVVEGSFYTKSIFQYIYENCQERVRYDFVKPFKFNYKDFYNHKLIYYLIKKVFPTKFYVTGEVYPATFAFLKSKVRGWPYCYFNTKFNRGFVTIDEIKSLVSVDYSTLPKNDRHKSGRFFYSVKRVVRTEKDEVRNYIINELMK